MKYYRCLLTPFPSDLIKNSITNYAPKHWSFNVVHKTGPSNVVHKTGPSNVVHKTGPSNVVHKAGPK